MDSQDSQNRLPRRRVLQLFAAAAAAEGVALPAALAQAVKPAATSATGYGTDPKLAKSYERGEVWPLTLTEVEKKTTVALADMIFPKDELGPAASEVRVADFIDEWVSAPYPTQQNDRKVIIPGLKNLHAKCQERFQKDFADLSEEQKAGICDEMAKGDHFFHVFTNISAGAYYSDPKCWPAIGYSGNLPSSGAFPGPPEEVLKQAGVEQTVIAE